MQGDGASSSPQPSMTPRFARIGPSLLAAATLVVGLVAAREASAFCRSTTCRTSGGTPCPTDDDGCATSGAKLFWPTSCIQYNMNRRGTNELDLNEARISIGAAFSAWSEITCEGGGTAKMTFSAGADISCKKSEFNKTGANVNVVLFQDEKWNYRGIDGTLAKTSVTYSDETGEILDADIEVNTANNTVTLSDVPGEVDYDLESIMVHEVGHFIGIAHSADSNAIMAPSYSPGDIKRELTPDDVAALCAIYPPDADIPCRLEPNGGFSASCDDEEEGGGLCSMAPPSALAASSPAWLAALTVLGAIRRRLIRSRS